MHHNMARHAKIDSNTHGHEVHVTFADPVTLWLSPAADSEHVQPHLLARELGPKSYVKGDGLKYMPIR
jgi:hypothetical protein